MTPDEARAKAEELADHAKEWALYPDLHNREDVVALIARALLLAQAEEAEACAKEIRKRARVRAGFGADVADSLGEAAAIEGRVDALRRAAEEIK